MVAPFAVATTARQSTRRTKLTWRQECNVNKNPKKRGLYRVHASNIPRTGRRKTVLGEEKSTQRKSNTFKDIPAEYVCCGFSKDHMCGRDD